MKIYYRHITEPEKVKTFDTVKSLKNNRFIHQCQKDYDEFELKKFESDKREGIILDYYTEESK